MMGSWVLSALRVLRLWSVIVYKPMADQISLYKPDCFKDYLVSVAAFTDFS